MSDIESESEREVVSDGEEDVAESGEAGDEPTHSQQVNLSRKAKAKGYRRYANAAGIDGHFGTAIVKTCYSAQDAKRFCRWAPAQAGAGVSQESIAHHLRCAKNELSTPAAQVVLPALESLARKVVMDATMRTIEEGKTRIGASHVRSAVRPYNALNSELVMPLYVVRAAQRTKTGSDDKTVLQISEQDEQNYDEEKRHSKDVIAKMIKEFEAEKKEAKAKKKKKSEPSSKKSEPSSKKRRRDVEALATVEA